MEPSRIVECVDALKAKKMTIAFAEGGPSGKICSQFAEAHKFTKPLLGGIVACKDHMKEYFFGINAEVIKKYGSESPEVAELMAVHLRDYLQADICVSVTSSNENKDGKQSAKTCIHMIFKEDHVKLQYEFIGSEQEIAQQISNQIAILVLERLDSILAA